jgi:DNA-binding MarR family transcriptional regulator
VLRVIVNHQGRPCPPTADFAEQLQMTTDEVVEQLAAIERAGFIEVETSEGDGPRLRMRLKGGRRTDRGSAGA